MAAINNFSNFWIDRKVIYCRAVMERVATSLNKKIFSGAELEPAPRVTDRIEVKGIRGQALGSQQQAEAPQAHGPRL